MLKRLLVAGLLAFAIPAAALADTYGSDSGPVTATATPANASHATGTALGCSSLGTAFASCAAASGNQSGVLVLSFAGAPGGDGIIYHIAYKSVGGSTAQLVLRGWARLPSHTTCQDNVAFAGSDVDDQYLIVGPVSSMAFTPAAAANTTGDSATYADLQNLTLGYKNLDLVATQNTYWCLVNGATDTADENNTIRLTGYAIRNQH